MVVIFVMRIEKRCYKFKIDNGPIVDLTPNIIEKVIPYLQVSGNTSEAGGCLVGFENNKTLRYPPAYSGGGSGLWYQSTPIITQESYQCK